jgi:class 3 adenylate cyclase
MKEPLPFGEWLRKQRRALDLSRQDLADQAGCAEVTLRRIESGTLKPSKELAYSLLEKVGIPQAELEQWVRFARGLAGLPNDRFSSSRDVEESAPTSTTAISSLPTGTVVFLYSDLMGFTRRWEQDPDATLELLARHDQLLHPMMGEYGGKVFNVRGDNFVAAFTDPLRAVEAAINAQRLVASEDWGDLGPVQIRTVLHAGQARMHSGGMGYVSLALGYLEPMEKFAQNGQIVLSQAMADAVRAHLPKNIQLIDLGERMILSREPAMHLFQLAVS